jgi:hypothetical protein
MFNFLFNHLNLWLKIMEKSIDLTLVRYLFLEDRTLGFLYMDGRFFCDTLEPAIRKYEEGEKKVYGKSAIPAGTYELERKYSVSFRRERYYLKKVPKFEGIMFHEGNMPQDTKGCILLGDRVRCVLYNSRDTVRAFEEALRDCSSHVTIVNLKNIQLK